jgi:hypothetical protein
MSGSRSGLSRCGGVLKRLSPYLAAIRMSGKPGLARKVNPLSKKTPSGFLLFLGGLIYIVMKINNLRSQPEIANYFRLFTF